MGRRTYEAAVARLGKTAFEGMKTVVVSRTLRPADYPGLTVQPELNRIQMQKFRAQSGKDIWLMGGGEVFRTLLEMGEVDTIEVTIVPVLLGGGVALPRIRLS